MRSWTAVNMWDAWCAYQLTVTHEGGGVWLEVIDEQ